MSNNNFKYKKILFDPLSKEPFKLSRSKIDLFSKCPRCFYLDRRLGVSQPSMPGFSLNSAVDHLLKKEFDIHRAKEASHPLMIHYGLNFVPFNDERIDDWRNNKRGIRYLHEPTNFLVFGAIDDVWIDGNKKLYIVDYKSTSTQEEITLDGEYKESYKRQMEVYQWLFRKNGFDVSSTGYFVYCNGKKDREAFDGKLEFSVEIIPYQADDSWVEPTIIKIKKVLDSEEIPHPNPVCEYCNYRKLAYEKENG